MTRENKLALVVGFGLILLVGILISDHLSEARTQEPAQLTQVVDPLASTRFEQADLIAVRTAETPASTRTNLVPRESIAHGGGGIVDPAGVRPIAARGEERGPASIGLDAADASALPYTYYDVRPGDALSRICSRHYGDASLAAALAKYNGLANPDALRADTRIKIPSAETLVGRAPASAAPATVTAPPAAGRTYTVREGDVLSVVAQRLLNSSGRYLEIYELNRDVMRSPDALVPGTTLRIPNP
jgi:LysM repeat protein